jgi:hypothetical protein
MNRSSQQTPPQASQTSQHVTLCGGCNLPIDIDALLDAVDAGEAYVHACGRELVAKRE